MQRHVERDEYLLHATELTDKESQLITEFSQWLPDEIIDCHAHCNLPEHVRSIDDRAYNHMLSTFPSFTLEESKAWHKKFHPGKKVRTLRFATVFRGIDHKATNLYLLSQSPLEDRVALYGLPNDQEYTIRMLDHPRVSALKMYYSYAEPPSTEIYHYFPENVLEEAQARDIPIVLHPPKRITKCLDQILQLTADFPRLRICLAHLSLTKYLVPGLEEAFSAIAQYPLVSFDTALVPSADVVKMALQIVGAERVMYGSDEPLHLIRSAVFQHPNLGERIVTEYPYHWIDPVEHAEYKDRAKGATHAHWLSLRAIREAISSFPADTREGIKQKLFHDNAQEFYGF